MSDLISLLIVGVDFGWSEVNLSEKIDVPKIRASVLKGIEDLKNTSGIECDVYFVVPDKETLFDEFSIKLRAGHDGKPWTAVIVG
jgi:hypothetical protein